MKMQEHNNKLQTNVESETQNFGIGDASVVIEILRNRLYENKVQTLTQEYICNARDAMREVGKGNTFEVTVPTHLSPVFKVRDFGPGISIDRMKSVFIMYGASTKRGTNNQTGGFGIGAKSAWSYTDSFTVVTVVDKVKRSYVAHTGTNNNGRLDLVSTEDTAEENGTEIQVAVNTYDVEEFRNAILRAVYFWDEKPILKGISETPVTVSGVKIGSCVEVIDNGQLPNYTGEHYSKMPLIVIDGVPYPVGDKLLEKCKSLKSLSQFARKKLIFSVGNGILEVSASRESIADSPKTLDNIEKMAKKVGMEVKTHIADAFGAVTGPKEYIETYRKLNSLFEIEAGFAKYGSYEIQGDKLKGDVLKKVRMTEIHCLGRYGRGRVNKITKKEIVDDTRKHLPLDTFGHIFFFKGHESDVVKNKRIRQYFSGTNSRLLLIELLTVHSTDATTKKVVQTVHTKELDTVVSDFGVKDFQSIAIPVVAKEDRIKVSREKTEFCMHVMGGSRYAYTTLDSNTSKFLYVPVSDAGWGYDIEQLKELNTYIGETYGVYVCGLADRALKMVQGNKNFSPLKTWLKDFKPSKKEINYNKQHSCSNKDAVQLLEAIKGIEDPELLDIMKEYKKLEESKPIMQLPVILKKLTDLETEVKDFQVKDVAIVELLKKTYPLVSSFERYCDNKQETVFYLNAKFNK